MRPDSERHAWSRFTAVTGLDVAEVRGYPYLKDTYELVQVRTVFRRLNRFMKMLHELRADRPFSSQVVVDDEIHRVALDDFKPFTEPLKSGFEILPTYLQGGHPEPFARDVTPNPVAHFQKLLDALKLDWDPRREETGRSGTAYLMDGRLLLPGEPHDGAR